MNRSRFLAAFAVGALLIAAAPKAVSPVIGQQAPDFTLLDQNGKRTSLAEGRGHKAVVVFYRGYW